LDVTVVTAQAQGWELTRIPQGGMVHELAADGFPAAVVVHGLKTYCNVAGDDGGDGASGGRGEDGGGGGGGGGDGDGGAVNCKLVTTR
jgi:hypothetical protein